jgi:hypothetical protein
MQSAIQTHTIQKRITNFKYREIPLGDAGKTDQNFHQNFPHLPLLTTKKVTLFVK